MSHTSSSSSYLCALPYTPIHNALTMSRNLKRSCSPVPYISRKARRLAEPTTDLEAYFEGWRSDLPILKLEPIDVPELLLSAFEAGPSGTAALPPLDLAASTSITTTPASTSTDLPNPIEPLAAPADPHSELPSVTAVGSTPTLTVSATAEATTTGPTTDPLLPPVPAAVHTNPPLDVPPAPEAANVVNGPRFQAKNSAFCIIGGDHDDDDDNTWARLQPCDTVPNELPRKRQDSEAKIMFYKSRVGSLEPMVYREGYRKTTETLGIFESNEFKSRAEVSLYAHFAASNLIILFTALGGSCTTKTGHEESG